MSVSSASNYALVMLGRFKKNNKPMGFRCFRLARGAACLLVDGAISACQTLLKLYARSVAALMLTVLPHAEIAACWLWKPRGVASHMPTSNAKERAASVFDNFLTAELLQSIPFYRPYYKYEYTTHC